jgi:NAD(P)-dependent dehydrogenase (short-subunit alcohol dehydrogenase family)
MDIAGKVALITGAKRVGHEVARALATRGADVAVSYRRSREEAERTAGAVQALGRRGIAIGVDLEQTGDCERLVARTVEELGRLDVLVNMASRYESKPFGALTPEDLQNALATDLLGSYRCSLAAVPHMRAAGAGRIINFSDWTTRSGRPRYRGYLPYYVAKTAVVGLTEALALELAADGILVNAVAPGPILAPPGLDAEERRAVERGTPLGRWGGPEEIAKTVLALIESDFITGETVRVDGGRHVL